MKFKDSVFYTKNLRDFDPEGMIETGFKALTQLCKRDYKGMRENETVEYANARILFESRRAEPAVIAVALGDGLGPYCNNPDKPGTMMRDSFPLRMAEVIERVLDCDAGDPKETLKNVLLCDDRAVWQYYAAQGIREIEDVLNEGRGAGPNTPTEMISEFAVGSFVKATLNEAGLKKLPVDKESCGDARVAEEGIFRDVTMGERMRTEYTDKLAFAQPIAANLPYFGARLLRSMVQLKTVLDAHAPQGQPSLDAELRKRLA